MMANQEVSGNVAGSFWYVVGDIDYEGSHSLSIHFTKESCLKKFDERVVASRGQMRFSAIGPFPMSMLDGFDFLMHEIRRADILIQS